jgi:hypothetical protein
MAQSSARSGVPAASKLKADREQHDPDSEHEQGYPAPTVELERLHAWFPPLLATKRV